MATRVQTIFDLPPPGSPGPHLWVLHTVLCGQRGIQVQVLIHAGPCRQAEGGRGETAVGAVGVRGADGGSGSCPSHCRRCAEGL